MIELHPNKDLDLDDQVLEEFQRFIKRKREEAGYSKQQEAARAIGVSQDLISRLESRFSPNVRVGEFSLVLKAYNVSPNEALMLLGLYESPIHNPEHVEYVRKEIQPLLDKQPIEVLRRIRMVIQSMTKPLNNTTNTNS